eukprot:GHVU01210151.1.p1 GENE.GHVU01210151.1~~GHVU01210151.1.p1  ORF type:complete len:351 (-),score=40.58 GHVU01210151.1:1345-2397(-)
MESQHGKKWADYGKLLEAYSKSSAGKKSLHEKALNDFFKRVTLDDMFAAFTEEKILIEKELVDTVKKFHEDCDLGEEDEKEQPTTTGGGGRKRKKPRQNKTFMQNLGDLVVEKGNEYYMLKVGPKKREAFIRDLNATGISFNNVEDVVKVVEKHVGKVRELTAPAVSRQAASVTATNTVLFGLQCLGKLMRRSNAVGIALDLSTLECIETTVISVIIRCAFREQMRSFHVATVPMFERTTAKEVFETFLPLLDVLESSWDRKLVSVTTDGENKMTGIHDGVASWFEQEMRKRGAEDELIRVWCACHQLDLALRKAIKEMDEKSGAINNLSVGCRPSMWWGCFIQFECEQP